jgi:DNA mismatch repair ATPase MutS
MLMSAEYMVTRKAILLVKQGHEKTVALFRNGDHYRCFDRDAMLLKDFLNVDSKTVFGRTVSEFPQSKIQDYLIEIVQVHGYAVVLSELDYSDA